jgi:hypothetical protein
MVCSIDPSFAEGAEEQCTEMFDRGMCVPGIHCGFIWF